MAEGLPIKSAWGKKPNVVEEPIVSFVEIMDEELAEKIQEVIFFKPQFDDR